MNREWRPTHRRKLLVSMSILLATGFMVVGSTKAPNSSQEKDALAILNERMKIPLEDIKIESKCARLTILGAEVEKANYRINVTVRNDYDKPIVAYKFTSGSVESGLEYLLLPEPKVLQPGETRLEHCLFQPDIERYGIKFHAVRFEDGSIDGDLQYGLELQEYRQGNQLQRQHILRQLDKVLAMPDAALLAELEAVATALAPLSEEKENKLPYRMRWGMQDQRRSFLTSLRNFRRIVETGRRRQLLSETEIQRELRQQLLFLKQDYTTMLRNM